jgi:TetR/AcrR family transcriptional repressor of mexJK operon
MGAVNLFSHGSRAQPLQDRFEGLGDEEEPRLNDIIHRAEAERPKATPGRKADVVTRAAWQLFFEHGFSATSMDAVAKVAGVSKATLYSYFPSKEALFASLIVTECEAMQRDLPLPDLTAGLPKALREFARQYLVAFFKRKDVALVRIIANESGRFPELARLFYESGPLATTRRLAEFLERAKAERLLEFDDAVEAARQFLSLVRGELPLHMVLGLNDITDEIVDREIEAGLKFFLKACQHRA